MHERGRIVCSFIDDIVYGFLDGKDEHMGSGIGSKEVVEKRSTREWDRRRGGCQVGRDIE